MIASCDDVITKSKSINDNLAEQATQFDTNTNKTLTKVTQLGEHFGQPVSKYGSPEQSGYRTRS